MLTINFLLQILVSLVNCCRFKVNIFPFCLLIVENQFEKLPPFMSFIIYAIPFFLLLILIELIADKIRATNYYQFNDALNSLNLGIFSRITGILKAILPLSAYYWLYQNHAIWQLSNDAWQVWLFAFIAYDLGYYWVHRLGHRISIMWGSHVVHHSSEEYNLTTALRQTSTPSVFSWMIFLPLAVIGISPELLIGCGSLNLIYQFWVHTRHIDKMPNWFEAIFVTPSHHRVHHALNRDYIDKNYAGVFILWDKIFGSFQAEKDDVEIVYGVSQQLKSWNPLWANCQVVWQLILDAFRTAKWRDKFKVFLMPPGWRPDDVNKSYPRKYVTTKTIKKFDVNLSRLTKRYLLAQFIIFIVLIVAFLIKTTSYTVNVNIMLCALATFHLLVIGAMQERKPWSKIAEPVRLTLTCYVLWQLIPASLVTQVMPIALFITIVSLVYFYQADKEDQTQRNLTVNQQ